MSFKVEVIRHVFKKHYPNLAEGILSVQTAELYELLNDVEVRIKSDANEFFRFLGILRCENLDYLADPMERDYQQLFKTPGVPREQQTPLLTKSKEESAGLPDTSTEASGAHRDFPDSEHQLKPISGTFPLPFPASLGKSDPDLDLSGTTKQALPCSQFPKTNHAAVERYNAENPKSCDLVLEEDFEVKYHMLKEEKELEISQLKDQHERENQTRMETIAMQRCHIANLIEEKKLLGDKYRAKEQELKLKKCFGASCFKIYTFKVVLKKGKGVKEECYQSYKRKLTEECGELDLEMTPEEIYERINDMILTLEQLKEELKEF